MAKKTVKIPAGKSDERFNLITESKYTNVIVGGQLTLSVEDARGLYNLTTAIGDQEKRDLQGHQCRKILRDLAKRILFTTGDATPTADLLDMFKAPEPVENDPFDQPISERSQQIVDK